MSVVLEHSGPNTDLEVGKSLNAMGKNRPTGEAEVEVEDIPTNQTVVSCNDTDTAKML